MPHRMPAILAVLLMLIPAATAHAVTDPGPDDMDRFLAGYASAILEREFGLRDVDVRVAGGRLLLDPEELEGVDRETVVEALESIDGLTVVVVDSGEPAAVAPTVEESRRLATETGALPSEVLFEPLIADPRWPRFSASLQFYQGDDELDTVGSANFGGTLPLYGWETGAGPLQVGLQAGVFSIFDFNSDTTALINADYFVGLPLTFRNGDFSAQLRLYHQSSHLGDEFLLRSRVDRINLSYEVVDALLSIDVFDALRLYGGGGAIVRSEPDLDAGLVQGGFELTSPDPWLGSELFPIAALNVAAAAEQGWEPDYALSAGFDIRAGFLAERRLLFLFEYFNGQSPNGQFFEEELEYFGTGLQFYF